MSKRRIRITDHDAKRLLELINDPSKLEHRESENLEVLREELSRAEIMAPTEIPPDAVTMNSTVKIVDVDSGEESEYTLVFPSDADVSSGKISVLAPIGTALLGYSENDTVVWKVPGGECRLLIKSVVYQPEASGDYHL